MKSDLINIGIDIGGTNICIGLLKDNGEILFKRSFKTEAENGSEFIISRIIENIKIILFENKTEVCRVNSIGVGIPGTVNSKSGVVIFAPNIFWENIQITNQIKEIFDVPVYIGQDSRAAAWGEFLVGSGKGYNNMASVTLGTGIGCGMILDGKIFHGGLNTAGEFGHLLVEIDGRACNCGRNGCLETYTAGLAIVREAKKISNIEHLLNKNITEVTVKDVFDLALSGNYEAFKITETVVNYLGMGFVNLINLNSLELICISGGISNAPDTLLFNPLKEFIMQNVYKSISNNVIFMKSVLGDNAPLVGASLLYKSFE